MPNIQQDRLVSELRQYLDEVTVSGERVATDAQLRALASSSISDFDALDAIGDATRFVAAVAAAEHLSDLVTTESGTPRQVVNPGDPRSGVPANEDWPPFLRILGNTVRLAATGVSARRATRNVIERMVRGRRGFSFSNAAPLYVYEDAELTVYRTSGDVDVDVVRLPVDFRFVHRHYSTTNGLPKIVTLEPTPPPVPAFEAGWATQPQASGLTTEAVGGLFVFEDAARDVLWTGTVKAASAAQFEAVSSVPTPLNTSGNRLLVYRSACNDLAESLAEPVMYFAAAELLAQLGMEQQAATALRLSSDALSPFARPLTTAAALRRRPSEDA